MPKFTTAETGEGVPEVEQKPWRLVVIYLVLSLGWMAGSAMDIEKYEPRFTALLLVLGVASLGVVLWAVQVTRKKVEQPAPYWFLLIWVLVAVAYAVVHPISQRHTISQGNDSEDALLRGCTNLLHLKFPYFARTYMGNPITPMPGALFFATPFAAFGKVGLQNLFWLGALLFFALRYFRLRSTALLFALAVLANAHTLVNLLAGADYPVNCFYVGIAIFCFLRADESRSPWLYWGSSLLLGMALSSRPTYLLLVPPLLLAYLVQHLGVQRAVLRMLQPVVVCAAVTLPFYLDHPAAFSPLHVKGFLTFLPPLVERILFAILVGTGMVIAFSGFFMRLSMQRVFLLASAATAVILFPPGIITALRQHFAIDGVLLLGYTDTAYILFCLWAFRFLEGDRATPQLERQDTRPSTLITI